VAHRLVLNKIKQVKHKLKEIKMNQRKETEDERRNIVSFVDKTEGQDSKGTPTEND
jgi:hypothetical protein